MPPTADYIFGTDPLEVRRLAHQHRLWSDRCLAHWKRAGFTLGQTLLDLGCGPGFASWDLAEFVGPEGRIVAVERAERYAHHLRAELEERSVRPRAPIDLILSSAEEAPLKPASLDGAYARWVFTFIPDLDVVLDRLQAALRPGAPLAILDYFNWKAVAWGPRNETLDLIRDAVLATYEMIHKEMSIPEIGSFAIIQDPQGAVFAAYMPETPDSSPAKEAVVREFSWHELLTTEHSAAFEFYSGVFGWNKTESMDMGPAGIYQMYGYEGLTVGGMFNKPAEVPAPPHWMLYVCVDDVNAAVKQVKTLGGQVLNGPMEVPGGDLVAQCMDPQGAAFAIHSRKKA